MKSFNLILFSSFLALSACSGDVRDDASQTHFEAACVDKLKENLKAPGSFILVEAHHKQRAYVLGSGEIESDRKRLEYLKNLKTEDKGLDVVWEEFDLGEKIRYLDVPAAKRPKPVTFSASIDYDAQNGFGALLRGHATCEYLDWDGEFDENEFPMTLKLKME